MPPIDPNAKQSKIVGNLSGVLWLEPNGVYRLDGWVIPVGHDPTLGVDDSELVSGVHGALNNGERLGGSVQSNPPSTLHAK